MRWHPKPPSREMPWWVWIFVPLWGPLAALALAIGFAFFGGLWCKRWLMGPTENWRPWFAWYPTTIPGRIWSEDQRVWLEWIERRAGHLTADAIHRLPAPQPIQSNGRQPS